MHNNSKNIIVGSRESLLAKKHIDIFENQLSKNFSSRIKITSTSPYIDFIDNNNNPDYRVVVDNGAFGIYLIPKLKFPWYLSQMNNQ